MKRKENIEWRSSNSQIIQAGKFRILHGNVMIYYYLRKTIAENQTV